MDPHTRINNTYFTNNTELMEAYRNYMTDIAIMFGANKDTAHKEMEECLNFETEIFKIQTPVDHINFSEYKTHVTINELSQAHISIPMLKLVNNILISRNISVNETSVVIVIDRKYIIELEKLLQKTPKRVLANYIIWDMIYELTKYMPKAFREKRCLFEKISRGVRCSKTIEDKCISEVQKIFSTAVDSMYVRKYFSKQLRASADEMVQIIRNQSKINFKKIDWMDNETRNVVIAKLDAISTKIGYPDEILDEDKLNAYYDNLEIISGTYLNGVLEIGKFLRHQDGKDFGTRKISRSWPWDVATVNAFYRHGLNTITIPAGLLQGSLYQLERPNYINYGATGSIIGHEIAHAFDRTGQKYNQKGNSGNWWQPDATAKFLEQSKCFIKQYSNYTVPEIGIKANGKRTLSENIADNGGMKLAYNAYVEWANRNNIDEPCLPGLNYTPQQMFWISTATNWCFKGSNEILKKIVEIEAHSPYAARVGITFSNIDEFANDFNCEVGSKMNPVNKCKIL